MKRKLIAMALGLGLTCIALNSWAGTFAPDIKLDERIVLDDTFYEQNAQLDAAFTHIRSQQSPKIITLGDSTMYGSVVYQNETIPFFLRQALQKQHPNTSLTNLAYPGARPADLYAMLKRSADVDPDLVVIDVNVVFYSERILSEGALANKSLKRDFLFEPVVPSNLFTDNRVEESLKTLLKSTNLGQYQTAINKQLFGGQPRDYIRQAVASLAPPQPAEKTPTAPAPTESIIGVPWTHKKWDEQEVANMSRIYAQGPLTEDNDSVQMLQRTLQYAKQHNIKVLYYLTPQNEALIGKFFDIQQLRHNEDFLKNILDRAGAWYLDLRDAVPSAQFGDYDHMLREAHLNIANVLAQEIAAKGGLPQ